MTGPVNGTLPVGPIVIKCSRCGWNHVTDAQYLLNMAADAVQAACPVCDAVVPFEVARQTRESTDCPPCPNCHFPCGTPIQTPDGPTTDRWYGGDDCTLWCPACGHGWVGNAFEVEHARAAYEAYEATLK